MLAQDATRRRAVVVTAVAALVLLVDGLSKLATVRLLEDDPVDLGWIVLRSARNTGVSFSLLSDAPAGLVAGLTSVATLAIVVLAYRGTVVPWTAGGLLVGGGLGNLVDRIGDGAVVDMFDLGWFPVFNVADVALNIGVVLVLLHGLFVPDDQETPDPDDQEAPVPGDQEAPVPGDQEAPVPGDQEAPVPGDADGRGADGS